MVRENLIRRVLVMAVASAGAAITIGQPGGHAVEAIAPKASAAVQPPAVIILAQATTALANANAGKDSFLKDCRICHTVEKGAEERFGPNLFGIVGRQAGTEPKFEYSDAFKKAATWKWDASLIGGWITNPGALIPGNAMAVFQGVSDKDRDNIIAYLATLK